MQNNPLTDETLARRLLRIAPTLADPEDQQACRTLAQQIFENESFFRQQQFLAELQLQQAVDTSLLKDDNLLGSLTTVVLLGIRHALATHEIGIHTGHLLHVVYGQLLQELRYRQQPKQLVGRDAIEMLNNVVTDALTSVKERVPDEEHELAVQHLRSFEQTLVNALGYPHVKVAMTHEPFPIDDDDDEP